MEHCTTQESEINFSYKKGEFFSRNRNIREDRAAQDSKVTKTAETSIANGSRVGVVQKAE